MARFRGIAGQSFTSPEQPPDPQDLQKFAAVHASIHNQSLDRHLTRRSVFKQNRVAAMTEWRQVAA